MGASPRDNSSSMLNPFYYCVPWASGAAWRSRPGGEQVTQSLQRLRPGLRACCQHRHITEYQGSAPGDHKLVADRYFVTIAVQQGYPVCVGWPAPIEPRMTDVRIAEIDQADKSVRVRVYKGMDRPWVRVQRH